MKRRVIRGMRAATDMILPRRCLVCGRKLNLAERHLCLCCLGDTPLTRFWSIIHNPMADRFNEVIQKHLEPTDNQREKYTYAAALFYYDSNADYRKIPYSIKYEGNIQAGKFFGKLLGEHLAKCQWLQDADVIIPVPLHWSRKWKRGYNQAEVIAKEIATVMNIPLRTDILRRIRPTRTQTKLEISEKTKNVKNAFRASCKDAGAFRHIILVDDVFTTGSTLMACFTALRSVFPPSVRISIATLAFVGGA